MKTVPWILKFTTLLCLAGCATATIEDEDEGDADETTLPMTGGSTGNLGGAPGSGGSTLVGDGGSPTSSGGAANTGGGTSSGGTTGGGSTCSPAWVSTTVYCNMDGALIETASKDGVEYQCCYYTMGNDPAPFMNTVCEGHGDPWIKVGACTP